MILNKFRPFSVFQLFKAFGLPLLVLGLISCNKSANINANKSFVGLTHVAYGVGPLNLILDNDSLLPAPIEFGQTSGIPGNPYDTAVSRINLMQVKQGAETLLSGNAAFQQGANYSIFVYDSTLDKKSVGLIILQDNYPVRTDTFTYVRYMNFSPGTSLGLFLSNAKDTLRQFGPRAFVGDNPNPSSYLFTQVHIGKYGAIAYSNDSTAWIVDSLTISPSTNYNVYLQGFADDTTSGVNKLQLKSVPLN
jgi:hypothetical protein